MVLYNHCPFYRHYMNLIRFPNPVEAETKEINLSQKYIEESIRIPILKGIENKHVENQINNSIQSDIIEFKQQMEEAAHAYGIEVEKNSSKFTPYTISTNYTITYNKNNVISVIIFYHELINGKNSYIKTSYNFDITSGKSLSLKDLFKPGTSYKEIINKEIQKELSEHKESYLPYTLNNFKGIAEDQPFYLENENIVLYLGFNQIAATVSQIPVIKIPLFAFKNELKPVFFI